jgi:hypothetical protein
MERHNIKSDRREFQLLTRLLTIDPTKRISGREILFLLKNLYFLILASDAMNDYYFKDDPRPTDE